MRDVRFIYKKQGMARFISHLDMNRLFGRVLRRSGLDVWHTEGYNQHLYLQFALPLSLGYFSEFDVVDFCLIDDNVTNEEVMDALKSCLPEGIVPVDVYEPVMKPKQIGFAEFTVSVKCKEDIVNSIKTALLSDELIVTKTTKKGGTRQFNVMQFVKESDVTKTPDGAKIRMILSAGNDDNINPAIIFDAICPDENLCMIEKVVRGRIFDKNMALFR